MDKSLWPARNVAEHAYCPRLFYYVQVEGVFVPGSGAEKGAAVHRRVDKPGALATTKRGRPVNRRRFIGQNPAGAGQRNRCGLTSSPSKAIFFTMPLQEARMPRYVSSPSMGLAPWSRSVLFRRSLREREGGEWGPGVARTP